MWKQFNPDGLLMYGNFSTETVTQIIPMYWMRMVVDVCIYSGMFILVYNIYKNNSLPTRVENDFCQETPTHRKSAKD
jgi:cytochrome c oxidase cbb3-type subunit I/II